MVYAIPDVGSNTYGYFCHVPDDADPLDGRSCEMVGYSFCDAPADVYGSPRYYVCSPDLTGAPCIQMCLTAADCTNGGPCSPYFGKTTISLQLPGYCHP
jgi:hypothetical protein